MRTTKIYIIKLFRLLLDYENSLEFIRHKLRGKDPDLGKIFQTIDLSKGNLLNVPEIMSIMSFQGYSISEREAIFILKRFDRNKGSQISFNEFKAELTPLLQVIKKIQT